MRLVTAFSSLSSPAFAHAGEQGFVLLLPTEIYVLAGTAAVIASMILVIFTPARLLAGMFGGLPLPRLPALHGLQTVTSCVACLAFLALIYIGFFGPNDPQRNLMPLMFWTGIWVALYVVQGTLFDIWRWVSPWGGLAQVLARVRPVWAMGGTGAVWPALGIYGLFQLFLLADIAPSDPGRLATFALSYWVFTVVAMLLFGAQAWLARGECFTVLFRLIGSLRMVNVRQIGLPGWWSIKRAPLQVSEGVFCLVILASGSFDGIRETFWWLGQIGINPLEFPGRSAVVWQSALGVIAANVALIAAFVVALWVGIALVRRFGGTGHIDLGALFKTMSVSILPIALGYHFAHYFVGFLVQSQYLMNALADPFGRPSALFGRVTTGFLFTPSIVKTIWLTQAGVVVGSHIIAVLMAHHLSDRFAWTRRDKLLLQAGLSVLMVGYTIFGLWLLASPRGA